MIKMIMVVVVTGWVDGWGGGGGMEVLACVAYLLVMSRLNETDSSVILISLVYSLLPDHYQM